MLSAELILFTLLPPLLMMAAGAVGLVMRPRAWVRSGILHLAAGVVFAVVAVELIPDLLRDHKPIETVIGFALGVVTMLGIRALTAKKQDSDKREEVQVSGGLLAGVAIDLLVDGLMMGIGFAAGAKEGRMLAIALAVELISLGLATSSTLVQGSVTKVRALRIMGLLSVAFLVGAGVGIGLLSHLPRHWLDVVLSFGAAALLFLVTEELLTEAHEEKESPALTAVFFLGFLAFLVLGILG